MNMFKIGDRVRVLDGSGNKSYYGGWASEMNEYVGKTCIIRGFSDLGVLLGGNVFTWDVRYLELVEEKKMENKITIDGKEYELSAELVEKIRAEVAAQEKAENPFERCSGHKYYFINKEGFVGDFTEYHDAEDKALYAAGNYCRDKGLMEQRALHETLNRLLWRYSEEHGGDETWDENRKHYFIALKYPYKELFVDWTFVCKTPGLVFFADGNTAQAAIEEVVKPFMAAHPEFVW